jgi:hypothetical protein
VLQLQVAGTSSTGLSFEEESTGSKESWGIWIEVGKPVRKQSRLGEDSSLGNTCVNLSSLDLSQLLGREQDSLVSPIQLAKNGLSITTKALMNTRTNGYAFMDIFLAVKLTQHF